MNKLNGQDKTVLDQQEPDPILAKLNAGLKKKDVTASTSPSASASAQVGGPSVEPTQKNTGTKPTLTDALKEVISGYNKPAAPEEIAPSPFINAVKRGWNLGEQANILGPFQDAPDKSQLKQVSELQKKTKELPSSASYQKFTQAKSFPEAISEFSKDPAKIIAELTGE